MRLLIAALTVSALLTTPAFAAHGSSAAATKFKKCAAPATFPEEGGSFTSLSAGSGVKCTTASSVATAWANCAAANGQGGRCVKKVKGYGCGEVATTSGSTRTSRVTCKKKKLAVKFGVTRTVATASSAAASCDKAGYKTLDQNKYVRLQRGPIPKGDSTSDFGYYACRIKNGKRFVLGGNECSGNDLGSVGDHALAGNYIAYEARTCGDPEGESDAVRLNVSNGVRGKASAESGPLPGGGIQDYSITDIVVQQNGNMAWIALSKQLSGGTASRYEVRRAIGTTTDTVATGPGIIEDSLALSGATIFWLDGTAADSASLP